MSESAPESDELELTIVMPCLDEAETLEVCIRKAQESLRKDEISGEVVIKNLLWVVHEVNNLINFPIRSFICSTLK